MKVTAIIAAAGLGRRMGGPTPKQYLEIGSKPIICRTLDRFLVAGCVKEVIIAVEPGRVDTFKEDVIHRYGYPKSWLVIQGGAVRQESVANALKNVSADCDVVLIHDGVRPFITSEEIELAANTAMENGACIVAYPIADTVKQVEDNGTIAKTVDRTNLWGAKTPQAFRRKIIDDAMQSAIKDNFVGTDEASLVERLGIKVLVIKGHARNIKITTQADIVIGEAILKGLM